MRSDRKGRRPTGFIMNSDQVSVPHKRPRHKGHRGSLGHSVEHSHMAREVYECRSDDADPRTQRHGPHAAEEFVRCLLPAAADRALGLPDNQATRQHKPWRSAETRLVINPDTGERMAA